MNNKPSSYRQIIKATSIFGGVQVFKIVIQLIRSKAIAVLLGPTGIGINSLLNSSIGLVENLTNFGLGAAAVKNVSEAHATEDNIRISIVVSVLRRLVWVTGLLGTLFVLVFSSTLSQYTFGNKDYTLAFIWISISLLFNQLSSGQYVLLQGLRKLKHLANASISGAIIGLVVTLPLYYFWGIDGIVPAIIATSLSNLILSWYFSKNVQLEKVKVSRRATIIEGKNMLIMGLALSLTGLISAGASYLLRIYISNYGDIEQVGLYSSGFSIIGTYVGMVFTAMGTDYYPRLAEVAGDNRKSRELINEQAEIALLILAPILLIFFVFIKWVVVLLYSTKFLPINDMIQWAALGIFFQATSWPIAFIFLAKGTARLFFWNELIASIYILAFNILGYRIWGLTGIGISFLVGYIIFFIQVFLVAKMKYEFSFERDFIIILSIQLILGIICFLVVRFLEIRLSYLVGSVLISLSTIYSIYELNKRLDLTQSLHKLINKD